MIVFPPIGTSSTKEAKLTLWGCDTVFVACLTLTLEVIPFSLAKMYLKRMKISELLMISPYPRPAICSLWKWKGEKQTNKELQVLEKNSCNFHSKTKYLVHTAYNWAGVVIGESNYLCLNGAIQEVLAVVKESSCWMGDKTSGVW